MRSASASSEKFSTKRVNLAVMVLENLTRLLALDVSAIKDHVQYWLLLSKVHFENGNWQEAANDLQKAKALQMKILNKSGADANINMMDERKIASK